MARPITNGATKAYLGDAVYAEIEDHMLKLTAENGMDAEQTIYLEHHVWKMLAHYMERHGAKLAALLAALCLSTAPAYAEEFFPILVTHAPEFVTLDVPSLTFTVLDDGTFSFGPSADATAPINLGVPTRPWRNGYFKNKVSASTFVAAGRPGINAVLHLPTCTVTIQGGIIVDAKPTDPFNPTCP